MNPSMQKIIDFARTSSAPELLASGGQPCMNLSLILGTIADRYPMEVQLMALAVNLGALIGSINPGTAAAELEHGELITPEDHLLYVSTIVQTVMRDAMTFTLQNPDHKEPVN